MKLNEPADRLARLLVGVQPRQQLAAEVGADALVAEEMDLSGRIDRPGERLRGVVQERRPAHGGPRRGLSHDSLRVFPEVLLAMYSGMPVGGAFQRQELGHRDREQPGFEQKVQAMVGIGAAE